MHSLKAMTVKMPLTAATAVSLIAVQTVNNIYGQVKNEKMENGYCRGRCHR
jgi:hypothetical protein